MIQNLKWQHTAHRWLHEDSLNARTISPPLIGTIFYWFFFRFERVRQLIRIIFDRRRSVGIHRRGESGVDGVAHVASENNRAERAARRIDK